MKLVINGREFDAHAQPFIGDLRLLKAEFGFGWGEVARRLSTLNDASDMFAILDSDETIDALMAWMWMAELRAGNRDVTLQQIRMTPIDSIQFKAEPGDELPEDGSVPTSAPTGSARGENAAAPAARPRKSSTKTSKKPSTAA